MPQTRPGDVFLQSFGGTAQPERKRPGDAFLESFGSEPVSQPEQPPAIQANPDAFRTDYQTSVPLTTTPTFVGSTPVETPHTPEAIADANRAASIGNLPLPVQRLLAEAGQRNPGVGTLEDGPNPGLVGKLLGLLPSRGPLRGIKTGAIQYANDVVEPLANIAAPALAPFGVDTSGPPEGLAGVYQATDPAQTPTERISDVVGRIGVLPAEFASMGGVNPIGTAVSGIGKIVPGLAKLPAELAAITAIQQAAKGANPQEIAGEAAMALPNMAVHAVGAVPQAVQAAMGPGTAMERAAQFAEKGEPALALLALGLKDKVTEAIKSRFGGKGDAVRPVDQTGNPVVQEPVAAKTEPVAPVPSQVPPPVPPPSSVDNLIPANSGIQVAPDLGMMLRGPETVEPKPAVLPPFYRRPLDAIPAQETRPPVPVRVENLGTGRVDRPQMGTSDTSALGSVPGGAGVSGERIQPWQMTRSDYMARGVAPLPENHPLRVAAEQAETAYRDALGAMMPAKLRKAKMDTATKKSTIGAAMEYQPYTIESALKSTAVPRAAKDAFRKAKIERDAAIDAAENATDHRTIVEQAIREGQNVPPEVLAEYPELARPPVPQTEAKPVAQEAQVPVVGPSTPAKSVWRETSMDEAIQFLPGRKPRIQNLPSDLYVATSPDLAIGQGTNKGVVLEWDSTGLNIKPPLRKKPVADFVAARGGGSEQMISEMPGDMQPRLRSITLKPKVNSRFREAFDRLTGGLEAQGWTKTENADGSIKWTKPGVVTPRTDTPGPATSGSPPPEAAPGPVVKQREISYIERGPYRSEVAIREGLNREQRMLWIKSERDSLKESLAKMKGSKATSNSGTAWGLKAAKSLRMNEINKVAGRLKELDAQLTLENRIAPPAPASGQAAPPISPGESAPPALPSAKQPWTKTEVSKQDVVAEAERQAKFQLPREGQTKDFAEKMGRANVRDVARQADEFGGYVNVEVPVEWLDVRKSHVDEIRGGRLESIGGSRDPIFVMGGVFDGKTRKPLLSVDNGNNRVEYAKKHGIKTVSAMIPKQHYEAFLSAHPDLSKPENATPNPERTVIQRGKEEEGQGREGLLKPSPAEAPLAQATGESPAPAPMKNIGQAREEVGKMWSFVKNKLWERGAWDAEAINRLSEQQKNEIANLVDVYVKASGGMEGVNKNQVLSLLELMRGKTLEPPVEAAPSKVPSALPIAEPKQLPAPETENKPKPPLTFERAAGRAMVSPARAEFFHGVLKSGSGSDILSQMNALSDRDLFRLFTGIDPGGHPNTQRSTVLKWISDGRKLKEIQPPASGGESAPVEPLRTSPPFLKAKADLEKITKKKKAAVPEAVKAAIVEEIISNSKTIRDTLNAQVQKLKTPAIWIDHQLIKPDGKYELKDGKLVKVQDLSKAGFERNLDEISFNTQGEGEWWGRNEAVIKYQADIRAKREAKENKAQKEADEKARKERVERDALESWKRDVAATPLPKGTKKTIEIKTNKGEVAQSVTGTAYGDFLVHKTENASRYDKQPWNVTHIGTGLGAAKAETKTQAIDMVRAFLHTKADTSFTSTKGADEAIAKLAVASKAARFDTPPPEYLKAAEAKSIPSEPTEPPSSGTTPQFPDVPGEPKAPPPKLYSGVPIEPVLDAAKKLPEVASNVVAEVKESMRRKNKRSGMKAPDFLRRGIGSTAENVASTGKAGENFAYKAKFADETGRIGGYKANVAIDRAFTKAGIGPIIGRTEFLDIGKKIENGEKMTPKQQVIADEWTKQHTAALDAADAVGMKVFDPALGEMRPVKRLGEKFYPNMPKQGVIQEIMDALQKGEIGDHPPGVLRKVLRSGNTLQEIVDYRIEKGFAKTPEEAIVQLKELYDPTNNGFFAGGEMARGELWPEKYRENNPAKAMKSYLSMMWKRIGEVAEFGQNEKALDAHLKAIKTESKTPQLGERNAREAKDFYRRIFGHDWVSPISRLEGNYTTLTKMALGFNAIKQLSTGGWTAAAFGPIKAVEGLARTIGDAEGRKVVRESAAIMEDFYKNFADTLNQGVAGTVTAAGLKMTGVPAADRFMRSWHAMTTLAWAPKALKNLRDNPDGFWARRDRRMFTDYLQVPKETVDQWVKDQAIPKDWMDRVLVRSVRKFQFENDAFERTLWGHSAFGRMMTRLRSFSIQQARLWHDYIVPEAKHGNLWPIVAVVGASIGTGELYTAIRNKALGRKRPDDEGFWGRLGNDIIAGGTFGLLTDIFRTGKSGEVAGIKDAMLPASVGTLTNVASAANKALHDVPKQDIHKTLFQRITRQLHELAKDEVTAYRNYDEAKNAGTLKKWFGIQPTEKPRKPQKDNPGFSRFKSVKEYLYGKGH